MRTGLIGKKIGCSSFFYDTGMKIPVTLVKIDECIVSSIKTKEKNGYNAVQISSIEELTNIMLKPIPYFRKFVKHPFFSCLLYDTYKLNET